MNGNASRGDEGHRALILKAIAEGGLGFAAQWIHDAANAGEAFYAESLARVTDSDGTVHTAGTFVSFLERQDRWFDLDLRILDMVLSALAEDETLVLGFNLNAASLSRSDRFSDVFGRISRKPELAARLVVEITESYPVIGASIERMKMIRALGCRIAIDDFGSGFATPASLLQVAADIVKIDAAFVRDNRRGRDGSDSLSHLVGFAACFAPFVVVEGIETNSQLEAAREAGATHAQGFFLSQPVSLAQLRRSKGKAVLRGVG
ncbi:MULTISPECIES: EAL domain-containing protein [unclassified Rhizobium]|uniref:EAL domain-containing protein n=1 Tax=unclassified Rhizobium TaxID=2613769 RepID=UPI000EA902BC|nr:MULTISPECIES: EAL domain-containing protein [unclassified Rhizobium]AYG64746.1 EAL domain-containing protein [Rhizobium sp. CCGE531]AYG71230.1 EAL domain-containing protein [Rhizobium sp. CCGE532]